MSTNPFHATLKTFNDGAGRPTKYYSLPALEQMGVGPVSRLPISIRIVLESVLRNCDGKAVTEEDVRRLANWNASSPADVEIPFKVARVVMQDFTGVPGVVDLAAMRDAVARKGKNPSLINPQVPVDIVIDHSVQVDAYGSRDALRTNVLLEYKRNEERYKFLKWGQQAFKNLTVVPPGIGIIHQVNLEYLARLVYVDETPQGRVAYPDTLVGTDSHTTMINGIGVVGWGVGGIEAEAAMLGQPVTFQTPEVVGVNLKGELKQGTTATDLVLTITQVLRAKGVVGKFVEFFGEGARTLPVTDRATIANMAPEYGATMGFFGVDEATLEYMRGTGRSDEQVKTIEAYFKAQNLWGIPLEGQVTYTETVEIDLATIVPSVAGPKLPQDRVPLTEVKKDFQACFSLPVTGRGFGKKPEEFTATAKAEYPAGETHTLTHGSIVIAAITSCTNTSNPSVMLAAGLLAKKAAEKGLSVPSYVKTSLAPGSRVVTDYLDRTGLSTYLEKLGFHTVGYGCTTCIGNSGPLPDQIVGAIKQGDLVAASVLSGNRNFEARVHPDVRANYLMSPPLVVAYAIAGNVNIDLTTEPLGKGADGKPVYLKDIWPTHQEVRALFGQAMHPETYRKLYANVGSQANEWNRLDYPKGDRFTWDLSSTYIQEPPFFSHEGSVDSAGLPAAKGIKPIQGARPLLVLGDNITTDHISPAGGISAKSPAGKYLVSLGVKEEDFNQYGARRGNDRVMTRGTFANSRIKNRMVPGVEGGVTVKFPEAEQMSVYDAAMKYRAEGTPLVVLAGANYGTGSSRDWAAKGTKLLGVKAVVAVSYERIHRSNLVGMGVLPLQFLNGQNPATLGFDGTETFGIDGLTNDLKPGATVQLTWTKKDGSKGSTPVQVRLDTAIEVEYYRAGGILDFVLGNLVK
ncbi:MAG TPA: aconitate hydratase AcnA [Candidatus Thermoplasmatota archaeon]|nr:aconitate hydratase AcnA [Candidatus Thermoplasmatota archaeon]